MSWTIEDQIRELDAYDEKNKKLELANAELRRLVKTAEWAGFVYNSDHYEAHYCPWCACPARQQHSDGCSAFTPDGEVK